MTTAPINVAAGRARYTTPSLWGLAMGTKGGIFLSYFLLAIENTLRLARPWILGSAINGLLNNDTRCVVVFAIVHCVSALCSAVRTLVDARVFGKLYSRLAVSFVSRARCTRPVTEVAARSSLSKAIVDFFETSIPKLMTSSYSLLGALIMLSLYNHRMLWPCLLLLLPVAGINSVYQRAMRCLAKRLHDVLDREVGVVADGTLIDVQEHFREREDHKVRRSYWTATTYALTDILVLGLLVTALFLLCGAESSARVGDVVAVFRYVVIFVGALNVVPEIMDHSATVADIRVRIADAWIADTRDVPPFAAGSFEHNRK